MGLALRDFVSSLPEEEVAAFHKRVHPLEPARLADPLGARADPTLPHRALELVYMSTAYSSENLSIE
jgi:hypothetical protein